MINNNFFPTGHTPPSSKKNNCYLEKSSRKRKAFAFEKKQTRINFCYEKRLKRVLTAFLGFPKLHFYSPVSSKINFHLWQVGFKSATTWLVIFLAPPPLVSAGGINQVLTVRCILRVWKPLNLFCVSFFRKRNPPRVKLKAFNSVRKFIGV